MPRPTPSNPWVAWLFDAAERGLRAYAASFVTLVGADQAFTEFNLSLLHTFEAALIGFIWEGLFSLAGKKRGAPDSASLLARPLDPPLSPVNPETIP